MGTAVEPHPTLQYDDSLSEVPSKDEIRSALQSLKRGKSPGGDEVTGELLKLGGEKVVQSLTHLAGHIWESRVGTNGLVETTHGSTLQERVSPGL